MSEADTYARDDSLPFRFPLNEFSSDQPPAHYWFGAYGNSQYHAAEDLPQAAGTAVYAMGDGRIGFSGPMGGYGWLIVVDHPQANLYSLYGHLSPSRWRKGSGPVRKGELIAYLGDPDENGGSAAHPLAPHLHFGVRAGQRADYLGVWGRDWRWQAGWVKADPRELGWLQPSAVISSQASPAGRYAVPARGLLVDWGVELAFTAPYLLCGACVAMFAIRRNRPQLVILAGLVVSAAGWIGHN